MFRSSTLPVILATTLSACAASRNPVPLIASSPDVSALIGEWVGDYSSGESGRSGSITFTLRALGDTAFGDVVMVPTGLGRPVTPYSEGPAANPSAPTQASTVRRLRAADGLVCAVPVIRVFSAC